MLARNLPYGMQRRLEIARAMVTFPKLLLLDEPAAGMNEEESRQLTEIIKELRDKHDVTIIIIDHHMDVIMDVCDKLLLSILARRLQPERQRAFKAIRM